MRKSMYYTPRALTRDNFFMFMKEKYPLAMDHFNHWIDEYKANVSWGLLFADNIKFHDLPLEMQMGILSRYFMELQGCLVGERDGGKNNYRAFTSSYAGGIIKFFEDMQKALSKGDDGQVKYGFIKVLIDDCIRQYFETVAFMFNGDFEAQVTDRVKTWFDGPVKEMEINGRTEYIFGSVKVSVLQSNEITQEDYITLKKFS